MPLITFSFAFKTETKEAVVAGNIDPQAALQILQQIVVDLAVAKAKASEERQRKSKSKGGKKR